MASVGPDPPAQDMSSDIAQTALTRPERLRLIWRLFVTCTYKWPLQVIIVTHWLGDKSAVFLELPALNCSGLPWIHQKCQLMENYLKISIFFTPSSNLSINLFLFHNERHYGFQKLIPPTSFLNFPRISLKTLAIFNNPVQLILFDLYNSLRNAINRRVPNPLKVCFVIWKLDSENFRTVIWG